MVVVRIRQSSWRLALLLGLGVTAPGGVKADPPHRDPAALLRRSEVADTRADYAGTKVIRSFYGGKARDRTVRIYHRRPDSTRIEFISGGPSSAPILQRGERHYVPTSGRGARGFRPDRIAGRTDLLLENYGVRRIKWEQVAGVPAVVLSIEPRHAGNPRKVVWIEPRSGLPLKTQVFGGDGQLRHESFYQDIDFRPSFSDTLFEVPAGYQELPTPQAVQLDFTARRPRVAPPGYQLVRTSTFRGRDNRVVHHMHYSDGLGTVSVFETRNTPGSEEFAGWGVKASGVAQGLRYAISGDPPAEELRKMGESIEK